MAPLSRDGPGLLLRDILKGDDAEVLATLALLVRAEPDLILLANVDHDLRSAAAIAFQDALAEAGLDLPYFIAPAPNSGRATGLDMDGNGRLGEHRDAMGYGEFTGDGGLLLLSRYPIEITAFQNFSDLLWREMPDAVMPVSDGGAPFPSAKVHAVWTLSTTGHWTVPIDVDGTSVTIMASYATPPVFDGPEDANGLRNAAETLFWVDHLDGHVGAPPEGPFILLTAANLDPADGDGRGDAMVRLLTDPRLQDPRPASDGGLAAGSADHRGDPALDTADWPEEGPGNLRVDYVLPSTDLRVVDAGVMWPSADDPDVGLLENLGAHRLVWVDLALP